MIDFFCPFCRHGFSGGFNHISRHSEATEMECDACSKTFVLVSTVSFETYRLVQGDTCSK